MVGDALCYFGGQKKLGMMDRGVPYTLWDEVLKSKALAFNGGEFLPS